MTEPDLSQCDAHSPAGKRLLDEPPSTTQIEHSRGLELRARAMFDIFTYGHVNGERGRKAWDELDGTEQRGWLKLASTVKGPIPLSDAGPYATAAQGDKVRELKQQLEEEQQNLGIKTRSWLGSTSPYAELFVLFEYQWKDTTHVHAYLIYPNGEHQRLRRESV
jgi:hypothetical protein